ncbi:unnamed protein product [Blepharisma stoltei]|uniref:F-box domain-containing protein n=1 Tax=Blepharisma stoltei TaxID=1481888 RepID=A0AAU9JM42_9CILI|nr:unnamed protein product [Blepharisma stoltei]
MGKKRQNEKKSELIQNLPTEILYIIIGEFLEYKEWFKLAQVCSWANFIVNMCWQHVKYLDFDIFPLPRDSEFISAIKKCTKLEKIRLDCYYLSLDAILALPISLTHAKLSSIDNALKNPNFIQSIQRLPNLKSLKFNTLDDFDRYNVDINEWSQFFKACKLDEISIGNIHSETLDQDISSFVIGKCKNYKALRLVDSPNIKKFSADLTSVKIEAHRNVWNPLGLNDWTIRKLSNDCQKLEKLKIIDYNLKMHDEFTSISFNIIINNWRNLRFLHLSNFTDQGIKSINDLDIMRVATVCRNLKVLKLSQMRPYQS